MNERFRIKKPGTMIRIGMASLVVGLVTYGLVHPTAHFGRDAIDGMSGFFIGIAIGFLLRGAWMNGRGRNSEGGHPCA